MAHLVGHSGAFDHTSCQEPLAQRIGFAAKGLVIPSAAHVSATFDGQEHPDARSSVEAEPRVDIDDQSDDRREDPFLELKDRLALGNLLVTSGEMKEQIDGFAQSQAFEHRCTGSTDAGNKLDWSVKIESCGQGICLLGSGTETQ